jgi:hypothetical protein
MKRMTWMIVAGAMLASLGAGVASANPQTPGADRREARQHARIVEGRRSGQLTRQEARRLRRGQAHVRRLEHRLKSDKHMTPRERARLQGALNRQSREIWRLKHNARVRG